MAAQGLTGEGSLVGGCHGLECQLVGEGGAGVIPPSSTDLGSGMAAARTWIANPMVRATRVAENIMIGVDLDSEVETETAGRGM